jgi:hypothetical protein
MGTNEIHMSINLKVENSEHPIQELNYMLDKKKISKILKCFNHICLICKRLIIIEIQSGIYIYIYIYSKSGTQYIVM